MPLKDKIHNAWDVFSDEALASQDVHDIFRGDRYQFRQRWPEPACVLVNADSNGMHIATLFFALFVRPFRSLVKNSYVNIAMPPLFLSLQVKTFSVSWMRKKKQGCLTD